jgi:hypothetical protein
VASTVLPLASCVDTTSCDFSSRSMSTAAPSGRRSAVQPDKNGNFLMISGASCPVASNSRLPSAPATLSPAEEVVR